MATWPFAGRRRECERLVRLAHDGARQGVVIVGPAGVGKSRIADQVIASFTAMPAFAVAGIRAAKATSEIPFGALAGLLPPDDPTAKANSLRWAAEAVLARAQGRRLVLAVDDAHLLDGSSAAAIDYLVREHRAIVVATLRSRETVPDSFQRLWRDGRVTREEVGPLTLDDTAAVLTGALGGQPDDVTVRRLWEATEGNALFLHELVLAARAGGALTSVRGMWKLTGPPPIATRLGDLIQDRIGTLSPEENAVLEYTALAEPIGVSLLVGLCGAHAVEQAEARGLIKEFTDGRRTEVRLGHPLYGEIARARCADLRRRNRYTELTAAVDAAGARRGEDPLRLTVWRLESGTAASPEPLLAACHLAWSAHDYPLAIRLGRTAAQAGGGAEAAVLLATVLDYAQRPAEARAVLEETEDPHGDEPLRARLLLARASNLAWGANRLDDAMDLLERGAPGFADPGLRQELAVRRLSLTATAARPASALALSEPLLDGAPAVRAQALNARALALCYAGRTGEAVEMVREALGDSGAWREANPAMVSPLHSTWSLSGLFAGDLAVMDEAIASMEAAAAAQRGWSRGEGSLALAKGHRAILSGRLETALSVLHDPAHHETARTVGGCMGLYAAARALRGEAKGAEDALEEALRRNVATWTGFGRWVDLTRSWIAAAYGDLVKAVDLALSAAGQCREAGLPGFEFVALHDAVRLGGAAEAAPRLGELTALHDGVRVTLAHAHAVAAAAGDAAGLLTVAERFGDAGMILFAAEATAQAATLHRHAGRAREATRAKNLAWALKERCQGASTPPLRDLSAPQLTAGQRRVVELKVRGYTTREIAERFHLAMRTVSNHLRAAYQQLGTHDQAELAELLGVPREPPP